MSEKPPENEKDWLLVNFDSEDRDFIIGGIKSGHTLHFVVTSNYTIHIFEKSHKLFKMQIGLQDDDILSEGDLKKDATGNIRISDWPHHKKDSMLKPSIETKLNEIIKQL
jgi:hypothetical protein